MFKEVIINIFCSRTVIMLHFALLRRRCLYIVKKMSRHLALLVHLSEHLLKELIIADIFSSSRP